MRSTTTTTGAGDGTGGGSHIQSSDKREWGYETFDQHPRDSCANSWLPCVSRSLVSAVLLSPDIQCPHIYVHKLTFQPHRPLHPPVQSSAMQSNRSISWETKINSCVGLEWVWWQKVILCFYSSLSCSLDGEREKDVAAKGRSDFSLCHPLRCLMRMARNELRENFKFPPATRKQEDCGRATHQGRYGVEMSKSKPHHTSLWLSQYMDNNRRGIHRRAAPGIVAAYRWLWCELTSYDHGNGAALNEDGGWCWSIVTLLHVGISGNSGQKVDNVVQCRPITSPQTFVSVAYHSLCPGPCRCPRRTMVMLEIDQSINKDFFSSSFFKLMVSGGRGRGVVAIEPTSHPLNGAEFWDG